MRTCLINGNSMHPSIRNGDLVVLAKPRPDPRPGEVVVYREPTRGFLVAHRVRAVTSRGVVLAGDANAGPDPLPVGSDAILGRVILVIPGLGRLMPFRRVTRLGAWRHQASERFWG